MDKQPEQIVIPKEKAVFWLDKNGRWHNRHGPFEHKKIIDYFNRSIRKDKHGYHLFQTNGKISEKVYFSYQDCALFVFDFRLDRQIILQLNTGAEVFLDPGSLFISAEHLYLTHEGERIKFTEHALMKISKYIEYIDGLYFLCHSGKKTLIPDRTDPDSGLANSKK